MFEALRKKAVKDAGKGADKRTGWLRDVRVGDDLAVIRGPKAKERAWGRIHATDFVEIVKVVKVHPNGALETEQQWKGMASMRPSHFFSFWKPNGAGVRWVRKWQRETTAGGANIYRRADSGRWTATSTALAQPTPEHWSLWRKRNVFDDRPWGDIDPDACTEEQLQAIRTLVDDLPRYPARKPHREALAERRAERALIKAGVPQDAEKAA